MTNLKGFDNEDM